MELSNGAHPGISSVTRFVEDELDSNGDLLPPDMKTLDINLTGVIYTCKLGVHYIKKNQEGGSVVITASASSMSFVPVCTSSACVEVELTDGRLRPVLLRGLW